MATELPNPSILDLPPELLYKLSDYLYDLEDFNNLVTTCRILRSHLASASPNSVLRLAAAASSRTFFRPSPHLLIAATAPQLSAWASASAERATELQNVFQGGIDSLFELCVAKCGITLSEIRHLHALRFSTINPIVDMINKVTSHQWYQTSNSWEGDVEDAQTMDIDPPEIFFQFAIYGGLFGPALDAFLDGRAIPAALGLQSRLEFIKYCIPDWDCWVTSDPEREYTHLDDERRLVRRTGPYRNQQTLEKQHRNQVGLCHLLNTRKWRTAWKRARDQCGEEFETDWQLHVFERSSGRELEVEWKQELWENVAMFQGLE